MAKRTKTIIISFKDSKPQQEPSSSCLHNNLPPLNSSFPDTKNSECDLSSIEELTKEYSSLVGLEPLNSPFNRISHLKRLVQSAISLVKSSLVKSLSEKSKTLEKELEEAQSKIIELKARLNINSDN
jgi:hypothetical protein